MKDSSPASLLAVSQKRAWVFFAATIMLSGILFALSWVFVTSVDPYAENGHDDGLYLASSPATVDRYKERLQQAPYTLVFGTSRSHLFSDDLLGESVLNLHAVYGWPISVRTFLYSLTPDHTRHIRRIIYLLDFHTFGAMPPTDRYAVYGPAARALYKAKGMRAYLEDSWAKLLAQRGPPPAQRIHARGFKIQHPPQVWDGLWRETWDRRQQEISPDQLSALADIKAFAKQHGVEITFITPTVSCVFSQQGLDRQKTIEQRQAFVRILGSYVELTTLPGLSDQTRYFADAVHLNYPGLQKALIDYPWQSQTIDQGTIGSIESLIFDRGCE